MFKKGKVYKIKYPSMGGRFIRDYIIISPIKDVEISEIGRANIPFLFCLTMNKNISFGDGTKASEYNITQCNLERLTFEDYNEMRNLLSKTNIRYNRKTKTIIQL